MGDLLTIREAAAYLRLNHMTVYRLAQRGKIPASKVGGNWRISRDVLDDWIKSRSRVVEGRVLIVDDDTRVRDVLAEVASREGYQAVGVGSGEEALAEMGKQRFDLVFLDLVLPGVSGVDVLKAMKAKDSRAAVAIVTGYGDDPIAMEAISEGPLLLIRKPFRVSDIVEVLRMVAAPKR